MNTATYEQLELPLPAATPSLRCPIRPDGPGRIGPGQRVTCLPGSLPASAGGQGGGILRSIGPKTSLVDVYGEGSRRVRNDLLHPQAGPSVAHERADRGLRTVEASGRGWLPAWSWLGWTITQHLEYQRGERQLPDPPPPPKRLVIVSGAGKDMRFAAPAGEMYTGSYHRAARRAAAALATPGTVAMILSAWYGLLRLDDEIVRYEMRLGHRDAITAEGLRDQAEQLGVLNTVDVTVLAPAAYANLATTVWPHARRPLDGTRGIGDQLARFAAIANKLDGPNIDSGDADDTAVTALPDLADNVRSGGDPTPLYRLPVAPGKADPGVPNHGTRRAPSRGRRNGALMTDGMEPLRYSATDARNNGDTVKGRSVRGSVPFRITCAAAAPVARLSVGTPENGPFPGRSPPSRRRRKTDRGQPHAVPIRRFCRSRQTDPMLTYRVPAAH